MYKHIWLLFVLATAAPCMEAHAAAGASGDASRPQALAPSYLPDAPFMNATAKGHKKLGYNAKTLHGTGGDKPAPAKTLAPSYLPDAPFLKKSATDRANEKSTKP
jgi:hypothetical protein